jgi:hypothetical protein
MIRGMAKHVHKFSTEIAGAGGRYVVRAYSDKRANVWIGWLEFEPVGGSGPVLTTGEETSQPDEKAVEYWASGLEKVYLEGALARARAKR